MQLRVIGSAGTLKECTEIAEIYLKCNKLRVIRESMSVFESYQVRPSERIYIPQIWKYRIVASGGQFNFGEL